MVLKNKVLGVLNDKKGLSADVLREYENHALASFVYNTAIMEKKIKVSFEEVLNYTKQGISALKNTNSYDAVQISNLFNAHFYLQDLLTKGEKLNEEVIKNVHQIVMNDVQPGGVYRHLDIRVNGSNYVPTRHEKIYSRMERMFNDVETLEDDLEKIALVHASIEKIHPFLDGNGRTNRLVLNYLLQYQGYLPVVVTQKHKTQYFRLLDIFKESKDVKPFAKFLSVLVEESIEDFYNFTK